MSGQSSSLATSAERRGTLRRPQQSDLEVHNDTEMIAWPYAVERFVERQLGAADPGESVRMGQWGSDEDEVDSTSVPWLADQDLDVLGGVRFSAAETCTRPAVPPGRPTDAGDQLSARGHHATSARRARMPACGGEEVARGAERTPSRSPTPMPDQ
jgi:hypothetical protein